MEANRQAYPLSASTRSSIHPRAQLGFQHNDTQRTHSLSSTLPRGPQMKLAPDSGVRASNDGMAQLRQIQQSQRPLGVHVYDDGSEPVANSLDDSPQRRLDQRYHNAAADMTRRSSSSYR